MFGAARVTITGSFIESSVKSVMSWPEVAKMVDSYYLGNLYMESPVQLNMLLPIYMGVGVHSNGPMMILIQTK